MPKSEFFTGKSLKISGVTDEYVKFVTESQLMNRGRWKKLVQPFKTREDGDGFWRGEFFGKELRGASLMYSYSRNEELYEALTEAVEDILSSQDELGRICTYSVETEFNGWDLWCRKYVMTGLQHYYRICKDE